ncbi:hypothetical protein [Marinicella meishanensis]|uniref:hypothetical protein n=1 Tax=Marinicella meishanensis TaxID=2873263 RepID=UPI001CBC86C6|nr:hypothetical protein [Marinicella sp. NBU2979]
MKKILLTAMLSAAVGSVAAKPEPIIYGTVTDKKGQTHTGSIRWGDQETFLSDIFNGVKIGTVGFEHLTDDEQEALLDHQPGPQATIGDLQITFKSFFGKEIDPPYFNVPFGAIKQLAIDAEQPLFTATLHDGTTIVSDGESSNDLRSDIYVKDAQGNTQEFDMDELTLVTFAKAPANALTFGDGIYGTVTSSIGTFQGRVMWDKDERLTDEELDGNDEANKDYEIKFADIKSIEKNGNYSLVELTDGNTLNLTGTNDVNTSNRGIWVDHPDLGRVEIEWSQFNKLVIEDVDVAWLDFDDYAQMQQPLRGTVTLQDGSSVQADAITYDMSLVSQADLLYADVNEANRQIPLRTIKQITVKHEQAVELTLHDGSTLLAYGNNSVTRDNNGLLLKSGENYRWVPWAEVKTIQF